MKHFLRIFCVTLAAAALAAALAACSGSPEETAQWYLRDKPKDMRVPVPDQTDPGTEVAPDPDAK